MAVSQAEDDLSIFQQEMRGLPFQMDAHHREDDARREKNQSRGDDMEGVFVEEVDSGEEVGVQADGGKRRRGGQVWRWFEFLQELQRVTLWSFCVVCRRRTRPTFKRNYGTRMEARTCLLLRVTILKSVFMVRI